MNTTIDWTCFNDVVNSLSEAEVRVLKLVGIEERFLLKYSNNGKNRTNHSDDPTYRRFYSALILYHLINEFSFQEVCQKFNVEKGSLQSLQLQTATYAGMVTIFCNRLGWNHLEVLMKSFQRRMIFGVSAELIDLVRLSLVNGSRARIFFKAGFETISSVAGAKVKEILNLLRKTLPFQSAKVGDHIEEIKYSSDNNSDKILGQNGKSLKLDEAAIEIILEAQLLLKRDLQLLGIEWNPPNLVQSNENNMIISHIEKDKSPIANCLTDNNSSVTHETVNHKTNTHCQTLTNNENPNKSIVSTPNLNSSSRPISCIHQTSQRNSSHSIKSINSLENNLDQNNTSSIAHSGRLSQESNASITENISQLNLNTSDSTSYVSCESNILPPSDNVENMNPISQSCAFSEKLSSTIIENCELNQSLVMNKININNNSFYKSHASTESHYSQYSSKKDIQNTLINESSKIINSTVENSLNHINVSLELEGLCFSEDDSFKNSTEIKISQTPIINLNTKEKTVSKSHVMIDNDSFEKAIFNETELLDNMDVDKNATNKIHSDQQISDQLTDYSEFSFSSSFGVENKNKENSPNSLKRSPIEMSTPIKNIKYKKLRFENSINEKISPLQQNNYHNNNNNNYEFDSNNEILVPNTQPMFKTPLVNVTKKKSVNRKTKHSDKKKALNDQTQQSLFNSVLTGMSTSLENSDNLSGDLFNCSLDSKKTDDDLFTDIEDEMKSNKSSSLFSSIQTSLTGNSDSRVSMSSGCTDNSINKDNIMKPGLSTLNEVSFLDSRSEQFITEVCKTRNSWNKFMEEFESWKVVQTNDYIKKKFISLTLTWKFDSNNNIEVTGIIILPESASSIFYLNLLDAIGTRVTVSLKRRSDFLSDLFSFPHFILVSFDWNLVLTLLKKKLNQNLIKSHPNNLIDVLLMDWILDSENCCHTFLDVCNKYNIEFTNRLKVPINTNLIDLVINGKHDLITSNATATDKDAAIQATVLSELSLNIRKLFISTWKNYSSVFKHFCLIEMHVNRIIAQAPGFRANISTMESQVNNVKAVIELLKQMAFVCAGKTFNIDNPKEVSMLLFNDMKMPVHTVFSSGITTRRKARGQSTASTKKNLNHLIPLHPLPGIILEYRRLVMLIDKTINPLIESCKKVLSLSSDQTVRIKCSYQQLSSTGRLTTTNPNLQSVPKPITINWYKVLHLDKRDLLKKKAKELKIDKNEEFMVLNFRSCFTASDNYVLVTADYRQLELRILAHLSSDSTLIDFFINHTDMDIFIKMASKWLKKPVDLITDVDRQQAKQISYGIIYGISSHGLSEQMSIEQSKAEQMINEFMIAFPGINKYIKSTIENCRKNRYVQSITGRRRYLPEINSENLYDKTHAERQSVHSTIQGSAADIVKMAMVAIDNAITADFQNKFLHKKLANQIPVMVLHLHDELLYEVPLSYVSNMAIILKQSMENAFLLKISLPVKIKTGRTWSELNDYII